MFWEYSQPIEYNQKVENKYWTQLEETKSCFSWGLPGHSGLVRLVILIILIFIIGNSKILWKWFKQK